MRKVKHWLHIVLTVLTSGLWLPVYVILLATTEMFNRGYREGKAAGRVARQNEIDEAHQEEKAAKLARVKQGLEERRAGSYTDEQGRKVIYDGKGDVRFGCVTHPIVDFNEPQVGADGKIYGYAPKMDVGAKSPTMRYLDLCDWRRECNPLPPTLETEYQQLRQELNQ